MCEYNCPNLSCAWIIHLFIVIQTIIYLCIPVTLFHKTFKQHIGNMVWILSWNLVKWFDQAFGKLCQCSKEKSNFSHADVCGSGAKCPGGGSTSMFPSQLTFAVWAHSVSIASFCPLVHLLEYMNADMSGQTDRYLIQTNNSSNDPFWGV
jgi:hypothetical protein